MHVFSMQFTLNYIALCSVYLKLEYACFVLGFGLCPSTLKKLHLSLAIASGIYVSRQIKIITICLLRTFSLFVSLVL